MNKVMLMGRLTKDVEVRYGGENKETAIARFTLAVDRIKKDETDFINCIAFGKTAETIGKYCEKGSRVVVDGRIQTGSYEKDGKRVYTTDVVVDRQDIIDFAKKEEKKEEPKELNEAANEGFMQIPDALEDEGLPFN